MNPNQAPSWPSRQAKVVAGITILIQISLSSQSPAENGWMLPALELWTLVTGLLTAIVLLSLCLSAAARKAKADLGMLAVLFAACAWWSGYQTLSIASV